jgi:hypothetical protein
MPRGKKAKKRYHLSIGNSGSWAGRHSNIPRCCIRAWIEKHCLLDEQAMNVVHFMLIDLGWTGQYIPCNKCLSDKRVVRVHRCGGRCGCGGWYVSISERLKDYKASLYGQSGMLGV